MWNVVSWAGIVLGPVFFLAAKSWEIIGMGMTLFGMPIGVWEFVGAAVFFLAVVGLLIGYRRERQKEYTFIYPGNKPSKPIAGPEELMSNVIRNRTVFINATPFQSEVLNGHDAVLRNKVYEDCLIVGAALLQAEGSTIFRAIKVDTRQQITKTFIAVEDPRPKGIIVSIDCTFTDCQYLNIGFIGTHEKVEHLKQQFRQATTLSTPDIRDS